MMDSGINKKIIALYSGTNIGMDSASPYNNIESAEFCKRLEPGFLYGIIKRLMDIVLSILAILFSWPVIIYIMIYMKRNSSGSMIFKQTRIKKNRRYILMSKYYKCAQLKTLKNDRRRNNKGFIKERRSKDIKSYYFCSRNKTLKIDRRNKDFNGQPFFFYKFRTMYEDARERYPELYKYKYTKEETKQLKFKNENDPRVPGWANWLRESSLDELPNFINVLKGDMSIVGPRPDIPEMMKYYADKQKIKLYIKPGITGLAQIKGRGHLSFQDTLKYDIEYVKNQSLMLDMKIIMQTVIATVFRKGAF